MLMMTLVFSNLFALSRGEAAGDSNTKNAASGFIYFQTLCLFSFICCQGCAFPSCSPSRSPRHPELPPAPRHCFTKCKMWSLSDKVTVGGVNPLSQAVSKAPGNREFSLGVTWMSSGKSGHTFRPLHYYPSA